jgi:predicted CxxxxCH...CXXCH cytochrome family protein
MKKLSYSIITLCVLAFFGCSKLKNDNPAAISTDVAVHPDGFASPASANFHGKNIADPVTDAKACTQCHGTNFNGGSSQKSCNACHKHDDGISPTSANFHGKFAAAKSWNLSACKTCHGADYSGGMSGKTCLSCHNKPNGPENCTTCHGSGTNAAPPKDIAGNTSPSARGVGAHQAHLIGGELGKGLQCSNCHVVPSSLTSPGHITTTPNAQILFDTAGIAFTKSNVSGTTYYTAGAPTVVPNPSYSSATIKCSNTYCHGNFKNGNPTNAPMWNDTTAAVVACGTCHGDVTKATLADRALPKTTLNGGTHFPATACSGCHAGVVDANLKIIDPSKHINGKITVFGVEQNF